MEKCLSLSEVINADERGKRRNGGWHENLANDRGNDVISLKTSLSESVPKERTITNEHLLIPSRSLLHKIKIIGVGGCGGNAINNYIISSPNKTLEKMTIACNTDYQDLYKSVADIKFLLTDNSAKGFGAGGNPSVGELVTKNCEEKLSKIIKGNDLVLLVGGLGGGTGTGAIPVIARIARDMGILTIAIVTLPFKCEGDARKKNAMIGLEKIRQNCDTIFIIDNNKILSLLPSVTSIKHAFIYCDTILINMMYNIIDIISSIGYINLDFADVNAILSNQSASSLANIGYINNFSLTMNDFDKDKIVKSLKNTLLTPAPPDVRYNNIIFNVRGIIDNIPIEMLNTIGDTLVENIAKEERNVIMGLDNIDSLNNTIEIFLIATTKDENIN